MPVALGFIETNSLIGVAEASNVMAKTPNIILSGKEVLSPGLVTVKIIGEEESVRAAVNSASEALKSLEINVSSHIIADPDEQIFSVMPEMRSLYFSLKKLSKRKIKKPEAEETKAAAGKAKAEGAAEEAETKAGKTRTKTEKVKIEKPKAKIEKSKPAIKKLKRASGKSKIKTEKPRSKTKKVKAGPEKLNAKLNKQKVKPKKQKVKTEKPKIKTKKSQPEADQLLAGKVNLPSRKLRQIKSQKSEIKDAGSELVKSEAEIKEIEKPGAESIEPSLKKSEAGIKENGKPETEVQTPQAENVPADQKSLNEEEDIFIVHHPEKLLRTGSIKKTAEEKIPELKERKRTSYSNDTILRLRQEALGLNKPEKKQPVKMEIKEKKVNKNENKDEKNNLKSMNVHQLRKLARDTRNFPIQGREISKAKRDVLLEYFNSLK